VLYLLLLFYFKRSYQYFFGILIAPLGRLLVLHFVNEVTPFVNLEGEWLFANLEHLGLERLYVGWEFYLVTASEQILLNLLSVQRVRGVFQLQTLI
jgi:hypothetical protein